MSQLALRLDGSNNIFFSTTELSRNQPHWLQQLGLPSGLLASTEITLVLRPLLLLEPPAGKARA